MIPGLFCGLIVDSFTFGVICGAYGTLVDESCLKTNNNCHCPNFQVEFQGEGDGTTFGEHLVPIAPRIAISPNRDIHGHSEMLA